MISFNNDLVALEIRPEASDQGYECQCYLLYHLVLLLRVMKDFASKVDRNLVSSLFLDKGITDGLLRD